MQISVSNLIHHTATSSAFRPAWTLSDSVVLLVIFLFKSLQGLPALQTELRRTSVPELNEAGLESAGTVSSDVP